MSLLQIIALVVKLTWTPTLYPIPPDPIIPPSSYWVYRAPLIVTSAVNEDGLTISTESCGTFSKWGKTTGSWMIDSRLLTPGATYCYALAEVVTESVTDLLTGIVSTLQAEGEKSEPIVVTVIAPLPITKALTPSILRASILPQ